ncbi:hypothetical protein PSPO01_14308 [Paraphaeosphaeria sporulosa]
MHARGRGAGTGTWCWEALAQGPWWRGRSDPLRRQARARGFTGGGMELELLFSVLSLQRRGAGAQDSKDGCVWEWSIHAAFGLRAPPRDCQGIAPALSCPQACSPCARRVGSDLTLSAAPRTPVRLCSGLWSLPVFGLLLCVPNLRLRTESVSPCERVSRDQRGTISASAQSSPPHNVPPRPTALTNARFRHMIRPLRGDGLYHINSNIAPPIPRKSRQQLR